MGTRIYFQTFNPSQTISQFPCPNVIIPESLCHLFQRNDPSRGDNPDLAHPASQHFADMTGTRNKFPRSYNH
jgi:hypothetical protein